MINKRKFLAPIAALVSVILTPQASAAIDSNSNENQATDTNAIQNKGISNEVVVQNGNGDLFKFIMQRSDAGLLMAYHSSHSSHSSHRSHSSHSSHYSSR
jgi:hypothetical protein